MTGLYTLQPRHGIGKIEVEAAHVDKAPIYPTIRAWSLRERSWRLTGHEVREREDTEEETDEGAHSFMFNITLNLVLKLYCRNDVNSKAEEHGEYTERVT